MQKTIFLNNDIEVLVVSAGGVGTTFLMKAIEKFKKTNCPDNTDGYKHLPIPPISSNKNLKVIYVFGNPILASMSLFRRKYHHTQSVQTQKFHTSNFVIPIEMTLEEYSKKGEDGHFFERHFENWYSKFRLHDTLFLKYETVFENVEAISEFLGMPSDFVNNFPEKRKRKADLETVSEDIQKGLQNLYGNFSEQLEKRSPTEIRNRESQFFWTQKPYQNALKIALAKNLPMISKVQHFINSEGSLRTKLARLKRKFFKKPYVKDPRFPTYWFDYMLKDKPAFLVQIGSNDGKTGDPLYPLFQKNKSWKGLFVEPIPHFFEKLQNNYPDKSRFSFENVAINEGKKLPFFWVDSRAEKELPDLPFWYEQLGSFDRNHIEKELDGKLKPFIVSKELEGITLENLFERNEVQQIDVLHIDAEGYDWKILSQLDLTKHKPSFVLFEFHHLSKEEAAAANQFLSDDYWLFRTGIDALAVRRDLEKRVLSKMRQQLKLVKP